MRDSSVTHISGQTTSSAGPGCPNQNMMHVISTWCVTVDPSQKVTIFTIMEIDITDSNPRCIIVLTVLTVVMINMSNNGNISLNLYTWNASGVMTSGIYLSDLLHQCNINLLGICEHWLFEKDLHFLNTFSNLYSSYAVSDKDLAFNGNCRTGKGGVAILWKKKYDSCVTQLPFICDKILGIQ